MKKAGRIRVPGKVPVGSGGDGTPIMPTVLGGTNWYPPSYSPKSGLFYVSAWENSKSGGGGGQRGAANTTPMADTALAPNVKTEEEGYGVVRADPARPEVLGSPLMRRLNLVVAGAIVAGRDRAAPDLATDRPGPRCSGRGRRHGAAGHHRGTRATAVASDRLFNPQPWGSWFEFALPDLPVAIDSRIELFPAATWDTYENIVAGGDGWAKQLADWGVTMIVVGAKETAMADRLAAAGWRSVYSDADGSIIVAPDR